MVKAVKKALSLVLCGVMLFCAAPFTRAEGEQTAGACGDHLTWEYDEATAALTIRGMGEMNNYSSGDSMTTAPWQQYHSTMQAVVIENGVASIGDSAFYGCAGLTSVTIPDGVMSIGDYAFENCAALTDITISDSVTHIGEFAFFDTAFYHHNKPLSFSVLYIGKHLITTGGVVPASGKYACRIRPGTKSIADRAFEHCNWLTGVIIPDSVSAIGSGTFEGCGLSSIVIPKSVTNIDGGAFSNCGICMTFTIQARRRNGTRSGSAKIMSIC